MARRFGVIRKPVLWGTVAALLAALVIAVTLMAREPSARWAAPPGKPNQPASPSASAPPLPGPSGGGVPPSVDGKPFQTSWIGNTYPGRGRTMFDSDHVQQNCNAAYVMRDGRVVCNSYWDEGVKEAGVYRDGKPIGELQNIHCCGCNAVAGDDRYIYIVSEGRQPAAPHNRKH